MIKSADGATMEPHRSPASEGRQRSSGLKPQRKLVYAMSLRVPTATLLALVALASCSSNSDHESIVATSEATTEVSVTTTAGTAPGKSAEVTTTTQLSTTSTTLSIEEQVRAAAIAYDAFYVACLRAPAECDSADATIEGSDAHAALSSTLADLVAGGFFVGEEDPGYTVIESIEPMADHTLVTVCSYSTMVLYVRPPDAGETPVIQNDTPGTIREAWQFVQDPADGQWKLRRGDTLEQTSEVNTCPPE